MPAAHKKVLEALAACRTGELGLALYRCQCRDQMQALGRACDDRHCPACQRDKAQAWLETQTDRLLPCPYFLVTFTLPAALRAVARSHQRVVYAALFEASGEALRAVAADPKFVGTDRLGCFGVLHTWGRTLEYHPRVHFVVPGGGLSADGSRWLPSRADFLVPAKALSIVFRAQFREFLRRFLQHVLPAGFQKVRHYGFLSPNSATSIEAVRWLVTLHNGAIFSLLARPSEEPAAQPAPRCPVCGGLMSVLGFVPALAAAVCDTSEVDD
jgi:hypothetical protein